MKTFSAQLQEFENQMASLWKSHIAVPQEIAKELTEEGDRRVLCTINGDYKMHCALMPSKDYWYIMFSKNARTKLNLKNGSTVQVHLEKDTSEYGMDMPEELMETFNQEPEAFTFFKALTPGKQRTLIYIVSKVKNTDSRLRKALAIATHLNEVGGKLDFKKLNEMIKYYNNL